MGRGAQILFGWGWMARSDGLGCLVSWLAVETLSKVEVFTVQLLDRNL